MPSFNLPLSGNVTQTINPWNWFIGAIGQLGLININLGKSTDPELEQLIIDDVGSYGRQLGRMGEALLAVIDNLDTSAYSAERQKAIAAFRSQAADIQALKTGYARPLRRLPPTSTLAR